MALSWPESPRLIGKKITRLDGLAKSSGRAKYPSDIRPEGMLFAVLLHSPHAHAKITSIDTSAAEKLPGVKAVSIINDKGKTVRFHGDDIAAVAAETEEQARDAVRAIKVVYEVLPHVVTESQSTAPGAPEVFKGGNARKGRAQVKGKPEDALKKADVVIEGTYSLPVITHVCLESHGLTAKWDAPDKLTVWASTQAVQVTANELAEAFSIPPANVTVLTDYMGGGFGSKFGAEVWGRVAAELARKAGRPVRLFLDREQEHLAGGNRPSASGKVRIGATKDGKLVGLIAETAGTGGARGGSNFPFPYVYAIPNVSRAHTEVFVNGGGARAMRAPGHPQGCAIMEAAMDDLADKLGVDPLEFRLRNLDPNEFRTPMYQAEVKIGAELIGWKDRRKPRGQNGGGGPIKHGIGMGLHQWGGGGDLDKKVTCTINPDGSVEMKSATQDLGTGIRTVLAIIAAEVLGLQPTDVIASIGNSSYPPGQASGGSTTTPSMAPPALDAVTRARDALFKKIAPALQAAPEELTLREGQLMVRGELSMSWKDACRKLGMASVSETGAAAEGLASSGVAGCQFAEVAVDVETGVVRVKKIVAVQDSGLIIDRLTWESQVYGGVIMGLNYGLFEERIMDPETGVMLNPDLEMYKLAGASDIPEIVIHAYQPDDQKARGVIGIGEPPTIATAAAIANAVTNAIGVRVPEWPMTPRNVLNALATASKEGKA
ncbi:xanthine dehydrogenase family protein molybdopterin-binding subunit [Aquisphaera insulae]|uniref:xanthine dehydrogenase family protein molybdopterin-binding subunit n=1 Tax=Aquisphaera insulae TaxID=2712864 RepID=UPI0013EB17F6|nr:xanthine dehydrogenase family protein molybdopterin-binding subunit [Aquisphaera insulae]